MPLAFARITDYDLIKRTITHPKIYRWHCDEKSPAAEYFRPPGNVLYLAVYEGAEYLGLFALVPINAETWEVHTCLLPSAWGPRALRAYREGIGWVFRNTDRTRIIGRIRPDNRLALRIAKRAGLKEIAQTPDYIIEVEITKWAALRRGSEQE